MSRRPERDPDVRRQEQIEDAMPARSWARGLSPAAPRRATRTDEEIERDVCALRRWTERLVDVLCALVRDASPPTIPDADEEALAALATTLEERIARAAERRGHRYARSAPGLPLSCPRCARPIDRAAEPCLAR